MRLQSCLPKSYISSVFQVFIGCMLLLESGKKFIAFCFVLTMSTFQSPLFKALDLVV